MAELCVDAVTDNISCVTEFVDEQLERTGCPMKTMRQLNVVIDEIFSNIAYYAYAPGTGTAQVKLELLENSRKVRLTFTDQGIPFDPLQQEQPDLESDLETRAVGGLGIFMVRKLMDRVFYERREGKNILTVEKELI